MATRRRERMKAAVLQGAGDLRLEDRPLPAPKPGWVVLAVDAAGICGTDVAVYSGQHPAKLPVVLGHEFSGRVLSVGEGVVGLPAGRQVVAQGGWACGKCANCRACHSDLCLDRVLLGRTVDGCFAEAVAVHASSVYPLPEAVTALQAQSVVTIATALRATQRAGVIRDRRIAIIGPGHAGLLLLQVCRGRGSGEITVFGTSAHRLAVARELGAAATVNVRTPEGEAWRSLPPSEGFDVAFEASGTASGLAHAFRLTRLGGMIIAYGIIAGSLDGVPGEEMYARELTVAGSRGAGTSYQEAIDLLASGAVRVEPLVTHCLSLDDVGKGFALMTNRQANVIRVVLTPNGAKR
jgi:threonine dehydrogenase-like Zn-dependent dehydrogenase